MIRKWLAIGIILLFVGTCIIPAIAQNTEKPVPASRGNWLYVGGSGPGNYTRIQDAIDNASDGDTVFVYQGIYQECNISVDKGITLQGENKTTTRIDGQGSLVIFFINVSNVTVRNFSLENTSGSGFGQAILIEKYPEPGYIENFHISDCIITNDDKGIQLVHVSNVSISSCYIHHNKAQSIVADSSSNIQITDCIINNNGINLGGGLSRYGSIFFVGGDSNISISNCVVHNLIGDGIHFETSSCHKIQVSQNLIYNNSASGVSLSGWNQSNTEVDIHHNTVYGNSFSGIVIEAVGNPGARIHDNNISMNGPASNLTGYEAGIYVWMSTDSVTIENNSLSYNTGYGIKLFYSSGVNVIGNKIIGTYMAGIEISSECDNIIVRGNIFQGNKEEGLYVSSHSSNISENVFLNNVIGGTISGIDTVFYKNKVSNNSLGIRVLGYYQKTNNSTIKNHIRIICNNFLDNKKDVFFDYYNCFPKSTGNIIDNNFWDKPRIFAKPIFGQLRCPLRILENPFRPIPWICFDKNPTQEPYDIPGMS